MAKELIDTIDLVQEEEPKKQIVDQLMVPLYSLDPLEMKKSYMQRVEDYETEEEVILNRLRLRKYLRELMLNQKRLLKAAADAAFKEKQE